MAQVNRDSEDSDSQLDLRQTILEMQQKLNLAESKGRKQKKCADREKKARTRNRLKNWQPGKTSTIIRAESPPYIPRAIYLTFP